MTWLLFDTNFLCYRAHYSTGQLRYNRDPTGVLYGVFRAAKDLQDRFQAHASTLWCFDHGKSLREQELVGYKSTRRRKKLTDEEEADMVGFKAQVKRLKKDYLPRVGYQVFYSKGYEADDVIASLTELLVFKNATVDNPDRIVIVSADKDLYQLLRPNVTMFNPNKDREFTHRDFVDEYGIGPKAWATVKAMAGCSTDDIPGIPGVGEKTAIKFLRAELPKTSNAYRLIRAGASLVPKNLRFVKLPFEGCPQFSVSSGRPDEKELNAVYKELGFTTLTAAGGVRKGIKPAGARGFFS